jgi:methylglyoxal synthase
MLSLQYAPQEILMTHQSTRSSLVRRTIALIAHDHKKDELNAFCASNREILSRYTLIATGTTGQQIAEGTSLPVRRYLSGPLGGDAQIAARVAIGEVDALIFLVDPLHAHPHEPDIQGLLRVCNVHNVPCATNLATAQLILTHLDVHAGAAGEDGRTSGPALTAGP